MDEQEQLKVSELLRESALQGIVFSYPRLEQRLSRIWKTRHEGFQQAVALVEVDSDLNKQRKVVFPDSALQEAFTDFCSPRPEDSYALAFMQGRHLEKATLYRLHQGNAMKGDAISYNRKVPPVYIVKLKEECVLFRFGLEGSDGNQIKSYGLFLKTCTDSYNL